MSLSMEIETCECSVCKAWRKKIRKIIKELDEYFNQGFDGKMSRFILYPSEWKELRESLFGGKLCTQEK